MKNSANEIKLLASLNEETKEVTACCDAVGNWTHQAIETAFTAFGRMLAEVTEKSALRLKPEDRHKYVMDCCVAINRELMELTDIY